MKDIRFIVVHTSGPAWVQGQSFFEQPGLQAHVEHYAEWLAQGRLAMGGPFFQGPDGGMMIPEAGVAREEVEAFAQADPAVKAGLLRAEVRPWLVGMKKQPAAAGPDA